MLSAERKPLQNREEGSCAVRLRLGIRDSRAAFTLIELVVSVGLMAIFLVMIVEVFRLTSQAFSNARATVRLHQNGRAAFDIMLRDLAAAQLCSYEDKVGYFALGWRADTEGGYPVESVAFTTLAAQPGAKPLVPGVSPQVALVRYTLKWDGGEARIRGDDPDTTEVEDEYGVTTFNLVKQVRFPQLAYYFCDMNAFYNTDDEDPDQAGDDMVDEDKLLPDEIVTSDIAAIGVYGMSVRIFHKGHWVDVLDHGLATGGDAGGLEDTTKEWADFTGSPAITAAEVRILGGAGAPQVERDISSVASDTRINVGTSFSPVPASGCTYRIEQASPSSHADPQWDELCDRSSTSHAAANMYPMIVIEDITGAMDIRMPYLVEVTLSLVDSERNTGKAFTFTQRFRIHSAEQ